MDVVFGTEPAQRAGFAEHRLPALPVSGPDGREQRHRPLCDKERSGGSAHEAGGGRSCGRGKTAFREVDAAGAGRQRRQQQVRQKQGHLRKLQRPAARFRRPRQPCGPLRRRNRPTRSRAARRGKRPSAPHTATATAYRPPSMSGTRRESLRYAATGRKRPPRPARD